MLNPLLVLAVAANLFYIVSSTGDCGTPAPASCDSGCDSSKKEKHISCGGDPNAKPGCDAECRRHCPSRKPIKCSCPVENSCECKDGYVFDSIAFKCVRPKECLPACDDTCEVYSDCINGGCQPKNCSQIGKPIPCVKIDPKYCIKGCLCKDGYLRTDDGVCVPKDKCPCQVVCSKPHQVYDSCPSTCPPQTCESIGKIYNCPLQPTDSSLRQCKPDCICEKGYYMNKIMECISKEDCQKCTGPHEFFSCGVPCDNVCATLSIRNQTNCDIQNIVCTKMCYCEEGFARNKNNTCIPISQCDACGQNEVPSDCVNGGCDKRKCSQLGQPKICVDPLNCIKGCVCAEGYLRNDKDVCVPIDQCPSCGGDPNAKAGCGINCNKHCSDIGKEPGACIKMFKENACDCKDGFFFDDNTEKCVLPNQCTSCGGDPNAKPGCGINCNKHCSDIGKKPGACITLCKVNACDCKDGFFFDDNTRKCVPPKQCTPVCGNNEVYSSCVEGQCNIKNCSQLGQPIPFCPKIDPKKCTEGCLCKEGYLRADNGTCVPKEKCCSCGGDPNAKPGCGINCNKHCSDIGKEPCECNTPCKENACDCKDGFYYDDKTGKCVLPKQCSSCGGDPNAKPGCGINCNRHCSDIGKEPCECNTPCKENACDCKDGFYYDDKTGKCVPPKQCSKCCHN